LTLSWTDKGTLQKPARIVDDLAKMRTWSLSDTSLECYLNINSLYESLFYLAYTTLSERSSKTSAFASI